MRLREGYRAPSLTIDRSPLDVPLPRDGHSPLLPLLPLQLAMAGNVAVELGTPREADRRVSDRSPVLIAVLFEFGRTDGHPASNVRTDDDMGRSSTAERVVCWMLDGRTGSASCGSVKQNADGDV